MDISGWTSSVPYHLNTCKYWVHISGQMRVQIGPIYNVSWCSVNSDLIVLRTELKFKGSPQLHMFWPQGVIALMLLHGCDVLQDNPAFSSKTGTGAGVSSIPILSHGFVVFELSDWLTELKTTTVDLYRERFEKKLELMGWRASSLSLYNPRGILRNASCQRLIIREKRIHDPRQIGWHYVNAL